LVDMDRSSSRERTFTVVSCHFGDPFWITRLASELKRLTPDEIDVRLIVVDQDRGPTDSALLASLPGYPSVTQYPRAHDEIELLGHDHPSSLNRALRESFSTSHVVVMDSDSSPITSDWIAKVNSVLDKSDAIVAADYRLHGTSHPCFMVLPSEVCHRLDFAEGLREVELDTGRLIGLQLTRLGLRVHFAHRARAFGGYRGETYLDGRIYHHGQGSFQSSPHRQHRADVAHDPDQFFRRKLIEGSLVLTRTEQLTLRLNSLKRRILRSRG
jgi:hypothetical protein